MWDPGVFSRGVIDVVQRRRVDLEVLEVADHHGRVPEISFPRECGVCVKEVTASRSPLEIDAPGTQ